MLRISVDLDALDYEKAIPLIVPMFIKNGIAAKAAETMLLSKIKNKTRSEQNAMLVNFINEHKNKIIKKVNDKANENGTVGYLCNVSADIL